jgi:hypothetical protein
MAPLGRTHVLRIRRHAVRFFEMPRREQSLGFALMLWYEIASSPS